MCGIAGFFGTPVESQRATRILRAMGAAIERRGPDGSGTSYDPNTGVGFAHQRLAIVDLSDAGKQPMQSHDGRFVITFNGEIYNHDSLRKELQNHNVAFRGGSDTEVLLACFAFWGVEQSLPKLNGMFAFVLHDKLEKKVWMARDRAGEKPLYFGRVGDQIVFGSTLAAINQYPGFSGTISESAIAGLLMRGCVPAPVSIYNEVSKLPPATLCSIDLSVASLPLESNKYWQLAGCQDRNSDPASIDDLDEVLSQVVSEHILADRDVGVFLSGGIDSSLITAMVSERSTKPVRSVTIGFNEGGYNEAEHAKEIASYLKTDHTEVYFDPEQCLDFIPELATAYDEPFADSSQLPTMLVSRMASDHVTVALSGDGGDESFAGYERYFEAISSWQKLDRVPSGIRAVGGKALTSLGHPWIDKWLPALLSKLNIRKGNRSAAEALEFWGRYIQTPTLQQHYMRYMGDSRPLGDALNNVDRKQLFGASDDVHQDDDLRWLMEWDFGTYLPEDVLVKVDRASMHFGLETRAPLLDPRVLDIAWRLQTSDLTDMRLGKLPLRHLLARRMPEKLYLRPKQGFGIPLGEWLRGPLKTWAEELLIEENFARVPCLDRASIIERWRSHSACQWDQSSAIWPILMLMQWLSMNGTNLATDTIDLYEAQTQSMRKQLGG